MKYCCLTCIKRCYSLNEVCKSIESINISALPREEENLYPMTYKTDHLLPRFLHIMPAYREDVVHLPVILSHHLILQVILNIIPK